MRILETELVVDGLIWVNIIAVPWGSCSDSDDDDSKLSSVMPVETGRGPWFTVYGRNENPGKITTKIYMGIYAINSMVGWSFFSTYSTGSSKG